MKVLIVDDSGTMRAILKKTLMMCPVEIKDVYTAENGKEGLEFLKREPVDLVLADINMPIMGGLEMIDAIRGTPSLSHLPVLVISSDSSKAREKELEMKSVRHIRKPFTPEKVAEEIEALMQEAHHAGE